MELVPYLELFFLLLIGTAFAHRLFGRLDSVTPSWDVIHYGLLSALPVYVVTSSVALSLAEFAATSVVRFFVGVRLLDESKALWIGLVFKALWVALLAFEIPILME
uniref:Uncharacterized protein n=1 Tax=Pseudomonas phage RVTF4 TaxID=3236931 RepID=A0AB39CD85_9VIRU